VGIAAAAQEGFPIGMTGAFGRYCSTQHMPQGPDQVPPTTRQTAKHEKERPESIHIGRPTPPPVSFRMALREPVIVRKLLAINKGGVLGKNGDQENAQLENAQLL